MLYEDIYLMHYGIKGQRWGVRRFQNKDGSLTSDGKKRYSSSDTVFVSGSSKTQDKESEYYRRKLPKEIRKELNSAIRAKSKIVVGDAPGIDRQVQDYLNKKHYGNVEVYGPGSNVRYSANKKWKTNAINDPDHEPGSKEWLAKKDKAMSDAATKGLAVVIDEGAQATRNNVQRLKDQDKDVKVFSLNKGSKDSWADKNFEENYGTKQADSDIEAYKKITNQKEKQEAAVKMLDSLVEYEHKRDQEIYEPSRNKTDTRPLTQIIDEFDKKNARLNGYRDRVANYMMSELVEKSMDGYNGIPKSDRQKALYDYNPAPDGVKSSFDTYENWIPKYKKSKEYRDSEKVIEKAREESGLNEAQDLWYGRGKYRDSNKNLTMRELDRRHKILDNARDEFSKMTTDAYAVQSQLAKKHDRQIMRNALLDMGWPVTEKYMKIIEQFIWYD